MVMYPARFEKIANDQYTALFEKRAGVHLMRYPARFEKDASWFTPIATGFKGLWGGIKQSATELGTKIKNFFSSGAKAEAATGEKAVAGAENKAAAGQSKPAETPTEPKPGEQPKQPENAATEPKPDETPGTEPKPGENPADNKSNWYTDTWNNMVQNHPYFTGGAATAGAVATGSVVANHMFGSNPQPVSGYNPYYR